MIYVNWDNLNPDTQQAILNALGAECPIAQIEEEEESYPLTLPQTRKLIEGIDDKTAKLLRRIAGNLDEDGYGYVSWLEAKEVTQTKGWAHFAKGPLSGLHKRLRNITKDSRAVLLLRNEYWSGPEETWGEESTIYIGGPALDALRQYFKLK